MLTDRERYLTVLFNSPLLTSDAIVVLCGEDAEPRVNVALQLLHGGAAIQELVLTGKPDEPPRLLGADRLRERFIGAGVSPRRIHVDDKAMNTREQAVNVVQMAVDVGWKSLLLVASPYHMPRAFLTFVLRLDETEANIRVLPALAQTRWGECPAGMLSPRLDLLQTEEGKINSYSEHVAPYIDGLDYLSRWEK